MAEFFTLPREIRDAIYELLNSTRRLSPENLEFGLTVTQRRPLPQALLVSRGFANEYRSRILRAVDNTVIIDKTQNIQVRLMLHDEKLYRQFSEFRSCRGCAYYSEGVSISLLTLHVRNFVRDTTAELWQTAELAQSTRGLCIKKITNNPGEPSTRTVGKNVSRPLLVPAHVEMSSGSHDQHAAVEDPISKKKSYGLLEFIREPHGTQAFEWMWIGQDQTCCPLAAVDNLLQKLNDDMKQRVGRV